MQFAQKMLDIGTELQTLGHSITFPKNVKEHALGTLKIEKKQEKIAHNLIQRHYEEIKKADAILIVNETKNSIENYIGGNTLIEMAFAYVLKKKIYLLNPIPKMHYSDEIEAMKPCVLNGDISQIR